MEGLIGITFQDYALVAADMSSAFSIMLIKEDENKIYKLSDHLVMAISGEPGDSTQFAEYIEKNISLYRMRNGFELTPSAAAHFIQRNLADYLRSRTPYQVNLILAGTDTVTGKSEIYYLDYLGTMFSAPFAMHGYGSFFSTSVLDRYHKADLPLADGIALLQKVIAEIQKRLIINLPCFKVAVVDKDGVRSLPDITRATLLNAGLAITDASCQGQSETAGVASPAVEPMRS